MLGGTLIHNGTCRQPDAIGTLTVPLIQSAFGAVAMTTVGRSALLPSGFTAASVTAILLAPITMAAEPEHRAAFRPPAKPLTEKIFSCVSHAHPKARLDSSCGSWQPNGGYVENLSHARHSQRTPVGDTIGVSSCSTFRKKLHDYRDDVICACGAMMLRSLLQRGFRKIRFRMIDDSVRLQKFLDPLECF